MSTTNNHILLTSLGMNARKTNYTWKGKTHKADLTPLALVQLLDPSQRPDRVVAMVTEGARKTTWPVFKDGISKALGFEPEPLYIPDGSNSTEIREILEKVAQTIPEDAALTLDVTQGWRHFPFIFYALVLYLKSLRGVEIRGAYYGMVEGFAPGNTDPRPIIDLQPLLELPEWFHAVRMFRDQGTTLPIAKLLEPIRTSLDDKRETLIEEIRELYKAGKKKCAIRKQTERDQVRKKLQKANDAIDSLKKHSFAYESGLPLELGKASQQLKVSISKLDPNDFDGLPPLVEKLTDTIANVAKKSAFAKDPGRREWKQRIPLDRNELERQAQMIDLYLERGQLPLAVGLMREWVVSWAVLESSSTSSTSWLKQSDRAPSERWLGALGALARGNIDPASTIVKDEHKKFGEFWNQLAGELRNALLHHGMRIEAIEEPPKSLEAVKDFWNQLRKERIGLPQLGGGGRLLLSPQGTKPGVLFSALKVAEPHSCLVICSKESVSSISEAAREAEFKGCYKSIELTDPHGGFGEIEAIAKKVRPHLLNVDEVRANMTGGTTLMGLVIQQLVEEAQRLNRPVRRFALIDRRPPAEQDREPFVQGAYHFLDSQRARP